MTSPRFVPQAPDWFPEGYHHPELVGSGGEGEVWRARASRGPSPVAIKRYRPEARHSGYREFSAMLSVRSPHVLSVHEVRDLPSGDLVLVTEFCSGGTLRRHLSQVESMPAREVINMGSQLLAGLRHIHKAGLFHADLKPENIFRARTIKSPQWKIADFGLARREGDEIQGINLTPAYAAPEQYAGQPCKASDVYSLAVVLAEAFTGKRPRRGRHRELVGAVADDKLREFCLSCIDTEPSERPTADAALLFLSDFGSSDRIRRHLSDSAMHHARNLLISFAGTA